MASLKQRSSVYYVQYYVGTKQRRISTGTDNYQLAREKLRQFESAQYRGIDNPLPTQTPIADIASAYVAHIRTTKTAKSAQTDIYYLRDALGPICEALEITSRKIGPASKKRPPKPGQDRRRRAQVIEAPCFEQITTADVSAFISGQVQSRGLAPKTANRYRETSMADSSKLNRLCPARTCSPPRRPSASSGSMTCRCRWTCCTSTGAMVCYEEPKSAATSATCGRSCSGASKS